MTIAAAAAARDVAAADREAARVMSATLAQRTAEAKRDTRVQEARQVAAQPPEPRAHQPPRERLVDIRV